MSIPLVGARARKNGSVQSTNVWWLRPTSAIDGVTEIEAREGAEIADGSTFEPGDADYDMARQAGSPVYALTPNVSGPGIAQVTFSTPILADVPDLWFCWVDEPGATPSAANLVAYADDRMPPGTIITAMQFASMNNTYDGQVGAIRWYHHDGLIHQIFVALDWRRRNIGSALIYAAGAWHQANGWSGRLHADGRRTDLGEKFAAGQRHAQRVAPFIERMPEMDA